MSNCALTIAGSDSGGGAGIQADLKTFSALGIYGATAITAVTAQNTVGVQDVFTLPASIVSAQIDSVLSDIPIKAVKTGMLANGEVIRAVADRLQHWQVKNLVVDPVMVSASGHSLLDPDAEDILKKEILSRAYIVTPNIAEAEVLSGKKIKAGHCGNAEVSDVLREAARRIASLGPQWVLLKGGHLEGDYCTDLLYDGCSFTEFAAPRVAAASVHGTGCTLSAAIAAGLALGLAMSDAVGEAKKYITDALHNSHSVGRGAPPVNNLW